MSVDVTEQAGRARGRPRGRGLSRAPRSALDRRQYLQGRRRQCSPQAFVEIGLEKNGFLYVDEIVGPELEGKRHGRRIQDLLARGQGDPRAGREGSHEVEGRPIDNEISLPGRFVVYVPQGDGIGVSRRLEDDERTRLKDILRAIKLPKGGLIVRTAAEGRSGGRRARHPLPREALEGDPGEREEDAGSEPVYSEAELPLRVVRDLFTEDFERAFVDDDRTLRRITGYLKKTSPHMAERVVRHRDKAAVRGARGRCRDRSTLHKRVDLPSGGYLIFDYAEASTRSSTSTRALRRLALAERRPPAWKRR